MEAVKTIGKLTGYIKDRKYLMYKNRERHYFKKYKGYGISKSILDILKQENIREVIIIEELKNGERRKIETTTEKFYTRGIRHKYKQADYQLILPETEFTR